MVYKSPPGRFLGSSAASCAILGVFAVSFLCICNLAVHFSVSPQVSEQNLFLVLETARLFHSSSICTSLETYPPPPPPLLFHFVTKLSLPDEWMIGEEGGTRFCAR